MANRLYFRNVNNTVGGMLPSGEQSALTADYTAAGGATLKRLGVNPDPTAGMANHSGASLASLLPQSGLYGMFIANRFGENQDISSQTVTINIAMMESDANMNMGAGLTANVYIWRPSTGTLVGTICANVALVGAIEPTAGSIRVVQGSAAATVPVSALFADVLICEIWQTHTQGAAVSYTGGFYFDGGVVTTVNDTLVTDHASFINFSFDNLQIEVGFANGALNATLDAATLTASGSVTTPPAPIVVATPSSGGSGASRSTAKRKKFVTPDLTVEPVKTLDNIFGEVEEPEPVPSTPVEELPPTPTESTPLAKAVAASPPVVQHTPTLPKTSPVVVEEEEYSDEDLVQLLHMVIP